MVLDNLVRGGFQGAVYPVNPNASVIAGLTCYPSVAALPEPPDVCVIAVPARAVEAVARECVARHVAAAIVISAGFKETGPAGAELERALIETVRGSSMRLIGPNCLGLIVPGARLNASFAAEMPPAGNVAFVSQSGALGTAFLDQAASYGLGLSHFVSLGNKADLDEADLFEAWAADPSVRVVVAYVEAVRDGRRFVEAARAVSDAKPLVVLKAGLSDAGARAVSSHTGSLAGSRHVYEAALRKAGAVQAESAQDLFDLARAFASQPRPARDGICIITNAGGPAIIATDAAEQAGVPLASLSDGAVRRLRETLPPAASVYNPIDVLGDAPPERYAAALREAVADPGVGSVLAILTPQAMTDASGVAAAVAEASRGSGLTTLASFMGGDRVAEGVRVLRDAGIPDFTFPERAVRVLSMMRPSPQRPAASSSHGYAVESDPESVRAAIDHARAAGRRFITELSAARIAAAYGIAVPEGGVARDLPEALALAAEAGYPVVVKVASPDILHKSDLGGIVTGVETEAALRAAYDRVLSNARTRLPDARIWGVTVQKQIAGGTETIVGVSKDPAFGHVMMFGLGGIYVEVLRDVSFSLCPVSPAEAREMVTAVRSYPLLSGVRGRAPADVEAIVETIVRVSALVADFPEIEELDINPLIVLPKGHGAYAADVRIGIGE